MSSGHRPCVRAAGLVFLTGLIDDIVDRSDTRRGRATLHIRFGELNALMTTGYIVAEGYLQLRGDLHQRLELSGRQAIWICGHAFPGEKLHVSGGNLWSDPGNATLMLGPGREVSLQRDPRAGAGTNGWLESNSYLDGAGNWQFRNTGAGGAIAGIRPNTFDVWTSPAGASPAWTQQFSITNTTGFFAGSVGVGTQNPRGKFEVAEGSVFFGDMGQAGGGNMIVRGRVLSANNNIHLSPPGGSTVYINSDYREAGGAAGNVNLEVSGTITGGNIQAKYQDVAEWVPSTQKLAAGTVVVLDAGLTNHVVASAGAYDTKVAGVVSAEAGVILGVAGDDKVKVATTGRVKVRVDATRAPIKVGDLLVTSEVEGVAMKSVPVDLGGTPIHRPGTIIGKALEPLQSGTGEILVLLSLQ